MLQDSSTLTPGTNSNCSGDRALNSKHYRQLVEIRKLPADWVLANCKSISTEEATEQLGCPAKSPGILLQGTGWQQQFRPDKPWLSEQDKQQKQGGRAKAPKYRTPKQYENDYDAILPSHPTDKNYWTDLEALKERCWKVDGKPFILLPEGVFKAIAGCANGIPSIALLGVEMGLTSSKADPQGKRYLVPTLEKFARAGIGFIIPFDADALTNPNVGNAERKVTLQLRKFGVSVLSVTGLWEPGENGETKGMDDFIKEKGIEEFRQILLKAQERNWDVEQSQAPIIKKTLLPSQAAKEIAEKYRAKLAWNIQVREWFLYERKQAGIWARSPKEAIEQVVKVELDELMMDGYTYRTLTDTINLLKGELMVEEWDSCKGVIPLQNGVFDKAKKKLLPHAPGYRLTYCLPFPYDPKATCEPITDWMRETVGGKEEIVTFLLAYLNAVVNRRADLQRYLELIGPGGTGKSTYMRLATDLVGKKNTHITKHQILEESRFETANLYNKSLVLVTEADSYVGSVSTLLAITGQDELHFEKKMEQAGDGFEFEGMVITAGNEPSRSSNYTSGLFRRKIAVWFRNHIPSHKRRNLDKEFNQYLPGLLNRILAFSDEEVTTLIRDAEKVCPALREFQRETLCETNPIADWVDNKVVRSSKTRLTPACLYNAFTEYCSFTGQKPVSLKRFSNLLIDLCQVQLGWNDVQKGRDRAGRFITGLSLRNDGDFSPYPVTELLESVTDDVTDVTDNVTAETTAVYGCDGCDAFFDAVVNEQDFCDEQKVSVSVKKEENRGQSVTPVTESVETLTVQGRDGCDVSNTVPPNPSPNPSRIPDDELAGWTERHERKAYPNPKSDNIRSSQKRALAIRTAYRAANCQADLSRLKNTEGGEYSEAEIKWVNAWIKKYHSAEYARMNEVAQTVQGSLLDGAN